MHMLTTRRFCSNPNLTCRICHDVMLNCSIIDLPLPINMKYSVEISQNSFKSSCIQNCAALPYPT